MPTPNIRCPPISSSIGPHRAPVSGRIASLSATGCSARNARARARFLNSGAFLARPGVFGIHVEKYRAGTLVSVPGSPPTWLIYEDLSNKNATLEFGCLSGRASAEPLSSQLGLHRYDRITR
eukprot:7954285-Pyramimonas_sp.AAC.1